MSPRAGAQRPRAAGEHLVDGQKPALEAVSRRTQVEPEDPHAFRADELLGLLAVSIQALRPVPERLGVVGLEALGVLGHEAGVLERGEHAREVERRGVREHVALGEGAGLRVGVPQARDALVEQAPAGGEQPCQPPRVVVDLGRADVLHHPDRCDRVEALAGEVAVVREPDLHALVEAGCADALARERGLRGGRGDADRAHAMVARGVQHERAPAAADVEHALVLAQRQLPADHLELLVLRLLERAGPAREHRAAVRHGGVEEEREELVRDVVVVAYRARIPLAAVAAPVWAKLARGDGRRERRPARPQRGERQAHARGGVDRWRPEAAEKVHEAVEVAHLERPGDVRAAEAEL